ncbi:hypothetical protein GCM10011609_27750 [Lentzea pudingi]|uniref:ABC-2 type transporter transmembrane domain-containing protein n=1 Tax=Lentzea pudingi TaxID=1789439 RepID=A0ABQ2HTB5_9PSEU|nr:ABC transporter permease [Lentzea pudingi]GGM89350.1 hypothetical protein GCM10011609_27750 [Lentzea pudingi]
MTVLRNNARVLRYAFTSAMADMRATYTWKSWTFAWLARILCQVTLFALIGKLLGSPEQVEYLVVGNSVFIVADIVMMVCATTAWERLAGTLPLLVSCPSTPFVVFAGRSVQWLVDGLACSTVSLLLLAPVLGVSLPLGAALTAVPMIAVISVSVYFFGLTLAGLALRVMKARNLVGRLGSIGLMVLTGVQVPVTFWPVPVQYMSNVLPLTHGLHAVREHLHGAPLPRVLALLSLEVAVGTAWTVIAFFTYRRLVNSGRHDGTIEFGG